MPFPLLLSPIQIGAVTLKNRVVMGPTETLYASAMGEVTQPLIEYYEARARGGAGLIVLHSAQGNTDVDVVDPYAGSLRFDNNAYLPMLCELTERVHRHGAKIAALISIGGGVMAAGERYLDKQSRKEVLAAPSGGFSDPRGRSVHELSDRELRRTVKAYGQCAWRARQAGFDFLCIHALGGYLLAEFLSPLFNHRTDRYGGTIEGRARLLLELIAECQRTAGRDFPLIVRFSVDERCPGGRTFEEGLRLAHMLKEAGAAALDVSVGYGEKQVLRMPSIYVDREQTDPYIKRVRDEVGLPVFHQGKLHQPEQAEKLLQQGVTDLVLLSRGMIAEPEWVNKIASGREAEIRHCLSCNYCLARRIVEKKPLRCAFNPEAGREALAKEKWVPVSVPKSIAIVGGGPAGLEAARILSARGHQVDIYEATDRLCGGQLFLAQQPPAKDVLRAVPEFYEAALSRASTVRVHLNTAVDVNFLAALRADEIILANGAKPLFPNIPGLQECGALTAQQVLAGAQTGKRVVIAGGGQLGAETAHFLAQRGHAVAVLEMGEKIAAAEEHSTRAALLDRLACSGVELYGGWRITAFAPQGVTAVQIHTNEKRTFEGDTIVIAFGTTADRTLYEACRTWEKPVHLIGDARKAADIRAAIEAGFFLGLAL